MRALGLMSGTSLDGIDAAIIETNGEDKVTPGPSLAVPYTPEERAVLRAALEVAKSWEAGEPMPEAVAEAERLLTLAHAQAVRALLKEAGLTPQDIDIIGFHGQTVLHQPDRRRTVQIGMGAELAASPASMWSMIFAPPMSQQAATAHRLCRFIIRLWWRAPASKNPLRSST